MPEVLELVVSVEDYRGNPAPWVPVWGSGPPAWSGNCPWCHTRPGRYDSACGHYPSQVGAERGDCAGCGFPLAEHGIVGLFYCGRCGGPLQATEPYHSIYGAGVVEVHQRFALVGKPGRGPVSVAWAWLSEAQLATLEAEDPAGGRYLRQHRTRFEEATRKPKDAGPG